MVQVAEQKLEATPLPQTTRQTYKDLAAMRKTVQALSANVSKIAVVTEMKKNSRLSNCTSFYHR
jgi:hypothetical protein